jgi:hypothetical protein
MLDVHTTSFIQRHILQKSGQLSVLQEPYVHASCRATFEDEKANQLIIQNCTPHSDTVT